MTCRAILWDMDGTLLDSEPVHAAAFRDAVVALGLQVPQEFHAHLLGASDDHVHAALVDATGATLSLLEWRAIKWRYYQQHAAHIRLRQPVAALAKACARQDLPMAVVSNSTADEVALCLAASGLAPLFPVTISRANVARGKPDPQGYLLAARRLGMRPADCLVIEDSSTGATAGVAAGMAVLFHPQAEMPVAHRPEGAQYIPPADVLADALQQALALGRIV